MRLFSVSARGLPAVRVQASNWIVALGQGLSELGRDAELQRLACEVLPNGTVIARDIRSGTGYVVSPEEEAPEVDDLAVAAPEMRSLVDEIRESPSRAEACQLALEIAQEVVPGESGAVILAEKGFFRFVAASGPKADALVGGRLPLGTGVAGVVFQQRRPMVLGDAGDDPRHCAEVDDLTGYDTREMLCVPVASGEEVFGVLQVLNLPKGQRVTRTHVSNLVTVGEALGERLQRL